MPKLLPAFTLATALVLGGCQAPDGSVDWGNTLLVGAGVAAATALVAVAASSDGPKHRYNNGGNYRSGYGQNSRYGYGDRRQAYRGW